MNGLVNSAITWAKHICAAWQSSVTGIFESGRLLIEDQREFVRWWLGVVREAHRPKTGADLGQLSREAAESLTGIKHQQVSRWRNSLKDEAKYREVLFGPSYKKAMAGALAPLK